MNLFTTSNLNQLITEPTRVTNNSQTLIDLCLTNIPDKIRASGVLSIGIIWSLFSLPRRKSTRSKPAVNVSFKKRNSPSLTVIFKKSLATRIYPDDWKIAKVILLHKHGKTIELCNYRPISIISAIAKFWVELCFINSILIW